MEKLKPTQAEYTPILTPENHHNHTNKYLPTHPTNPPTHQLTPTNLFWQVHDDLHISHVEANATGLNHTTHAEPPQCLTKQVSWCYLQYTEIEVRPKSHDTKALSKDVLLGSALAIAHLIWVFSQHVQR